MRRRQWDGVGTALIAAARRVAEASGARRLWLITTNDNVDALRFYQRRGFRLARVDAGAVDRSRAALKPAHPRDRRARDPAPRRAGAGDGARRRADDAPCRRGRALLALELALARRDEASIPGGYEAVLAPDFIEIGASGRLWTRAEILAMLHAEPPNPSITIESIRDRRPRAGRWSSRRYDAVHDRRGNERRSRRSSIWIRLDGRWQLRFNQGTPSPRRATDRPASPERTVIVITRANRERQEHRRSSAATRTRWLDVRAAVIDLDIIEDMLRPDGRES